MECGQAMLLTSGAEVDFGDSKAFRHTSRAIMQYSRPGYSTSETDSIVAVQLRLA
jgi:hypothetical protein